MTAPIRVRRRWEPGFDPARAYPGYRWPTDEPWLWGCSRRHVPHATTGGYASTQPAALAAGLAHLDSHTETR